MDQTVVDLAMRTGAAANPVVEFQDVSMRYGDVLAVDNVSLKIAQGTFVSLLGPSGCGKTTSLRMIAGFEQPASGHVLIEGVDVTGVPAYRRPVNMVFQHYALFPHLNVFDNVAFGLRQLRPRPPRSEISRRVSETLELVRLSGLDQRRSFELSGGQQQRVALARALVVQPKVLLFDEPLSNLDAKLRGAMRAEIRRIQHMFGITSLYVTHDQDEAMSMSDRIVVMNKGKVEQVATPAEIYQRPATVFVADFIGRANFVEVALGRVEAGTAEVTAFGGHMTVAAHPDVRAQDNAAFLMVRPETISLEPAPEAGNGTVLRSIFHGHTVDYDVETTSGTLSVTEAGPDPSRLLAAGTNVRVTIDPRKAYLLKNEY